MPPRIWNPPTLPRIFCFGPGLDREPPPKETLGGKGASLAAMSRAGLEVPPGFTLPTACCRAYHDARRQLPDGLLDEVRQALAWLESFTGRKLGAGPRPLLVSVRSGAAVSMPGMMDTILNVGLRQNLEDCYPEKSAFWAAYVDFVRLYGETVWDLDEKVFAAAARPNDAPPSRESATRLLAAIRKEIDREFPEDPWDMLVESITAVFNSWNSERAIHYRQRHNIRDLPGTAVTVQAMFPSEQSGVLFTHDPTALAADRIVIEAAHGLGEAIVRGRVEPDVYLVDRQNFRILEKRISDKDVQVRALAEAPQQCLRAAATPTTEKVGDGPQPPRRTDGAPPTAPSLPEAKGSRGESHGESSSGSEAAQASLHDDHIVALARLGMRVEEFFGHPVDIEWGLADGRFALLQSRPIRGLEIARDLEAARQDEIAHLRNRLGTRKKAVWAVHNLSETLPAPLPLTWDVIGGFMSGKGGFLALYKDLGFVPSRQVLEHGFLELVAGRIYVDLERAAQLFFDEYPLEYDLSGAAGTDPLAAAPSLFNIERAGGTFLLRLPWYIYLMVRSGRVFRRTAATFRQEFETIVVPRLQEYVNAAASQDLSGRDDAALLAELEHRRQALDRFGRECFKLSFIAGTFHGNLTADLELALGKTQGRAWAASLLKGLEGDKTVEANIALYKVAKDEIPLADFLREFGHRAVGEFELAEPRWAEDPDYPRKMAAFFRRQTGPSPLERHQSQVAERAAAEQGLTAVLRENGASALEPEIRALHRAALAYLPYRETGKFHFMKVMATVRQVLEVLARRWNLGRDLYFLRLDELSRWASEAESLRRAIASRKTRWQAWQQLSVPPVLSSDDLEHLGKSGAAKPDPAEWTVDGQDQGGDSTVLAGQGVAPGTNTGIVRLVSSPKEVGDLGPRYIIVCTTTDPGWTPLFVHARGVVVERGGMLSHGAIVARDFGIPAVVLPKATSLLRDGEEVEIDGARGLIVRRPPDPGREQP